jgi:pimeloyl-ACP methyl ester carboxylesterase
MGHVIRFVFPCLFFTFSLFAKTTVIYLPRDDQSVIEGYLTTPENGGNFPVVVFIEGSFDASVLDNHEKLATRFNPYGLAVLSLEKRGISSKGIDWEEYFQHDSFEDRLQDYTSLLNALKMRNISGCGGDCILFGGSEGGKIAPRLGASFPSLVKGLVLIGSGGGLSFATEMKYQSEQLIRRLNPFVKFFYKVRRVFLRSEYEKLYAKMLASPDSLEMSGPKTWKWWASYLRYDLLSDLLKINAPIYMIHGKEDILVPMKSADLVKEAFDKEGKTNFTYARYEDLGHSFREDVYESMIEWMKNITENK